jgi:SAM-dependent methyltransferase
MPMPLKPQTSAVNDRLWGVAAEAWAALQEPCFEPVYEAVLTRCAVSAATHYLDVGCGSGMAAQMAAARGAKVTGIDASAALLAIARRRVPDGDFRTGDMEALPFPDGVFDLVTGFNSFQYAGNPVVALGEARRRMKPDGRLVIMTWGDPATMDAAALIKVLGPLMPPPPPGAPGPFALSDATALRNFALDAELTPIEVFDVDSPFIYPDEATAIRAWNSSGVAARAMENTSEAAVTEAHRGALAPFRQAGGGYRVSGTFRCLLAQR